jgi:hypothetical protein
VVELGDFGAFEPVRARRLEITFSNPTRGLSPIGVGELHLGPKPVTVPFDGGTPLHQACWFGQPDNARPLIEAGAPLDVFDPTHHASPIHWVAHGSSCSDGAAEHAERYEDLARILLGAGCALEYPGATDGAYLRRILTDAAPKVAALVRLHLGI